MTAPVRIDLASLSPEDLVRLREMLRTRPGQRSPETQAAITMQHRLIVEVALNFYMGVEIIAQNVFIAISAGIKPQHGNAIAPTPNAPIPIRAFDCFGKFSRPECGISIAFFLAGFELSYPDFVANRMCFLRDGNDQ